MGSRLLRGLSPRAEGRPDYRYSTLVRNRAHGAAAAALWPNGRIESMGGCAGSRRTLAEQEHADQSAPDGSYSQLVRSGGLSVDELAAPFQAWSVCWRGYGRGSLRRSFPINSPLAGVAQSRQRAGSAWWSELAVRRRSLPSNIPVVSASLLLDTQAGATVAESRALLGAAWAQTTLTLSDNSGHNERWRSWINGGRRDDAGQWPCYWPRASKPAVPLRSQLRGAVISRKAGK